MTQDHLPMRDNKWLEGELDFLLKNYFSDVKLTDPIHIKFGREAKYRFGSIRLVKPRKFGGLRVLRKLSQLRDEKPQRSVITITSMFAKEDVPADVVRYTIAHELCHYAHGFSSANRRLFKYPHHGGIVNKELASRGAGHLTGVFKKWLKAYRRKILKGRETL